MKFKIFSGLVIFCSFAFTFLVSPDISGKWTGTLKTPGNGEYPLSYVFNVDGNKLTGTGLTPQGDLDFTNGKLTGNDFTFDLSVNDSNAKHIGKYIAQGDSISLDIEYENSVLHATLIRSKK